LTSPQPLHFVTPEEAEVGRITITGIGTPEVAEGHALPQRREMPLPVRCKALTLSKEEDSLLEAPRWVFSEEEPPTKMTSQSIRGC